MRLHHGWPAQVLGTQCLRQAGRWHDNGPHHAYYHHALADAAHYGYRVRLVRGFRSWWEKAAVTLELRISIKRATRLAMWHTWRAAIYSARAGAEDSARTQCAVLT